MSQKAVYTPPQHAANAVFAHEGCSKGSCAFGVRLGKHFLKEIPSKRVAYLMGKVTYLMGGGGGRYF